MSAPGRPKREQALERGSAKGSSVTVVVRRARHEDVPQLAAWNAQLIRDEHNDAAAPADEIEPRLRDWLAKDYVACVFENTASVPPDRPEGLTAPPWGAVSEANVGAYIPFGYAIFRDLPDCVHLRHFFVEASFRRRGFGRRAFELMREMFPRGKQILVEVLAGNATGAAFWKSVGFETRYLGLQLNTGD